MGVKQLGHSGVSHRIGCRKGKKLLEKCWGLVMRAMNRLSQFWSWTLKHDLCNGKLVWLRYRSQ